MPAMHIYEQTIDDGAARGSRVIVLIQDPKIPEPAIPGAENDGIIEADVAAFVRSRKAGGEPVLVLRNHFTLRRARLTLNDPDNAVTLPGPAEDREELCGFLSDLVRLFLEDLARKIFPEKAHLL